MALIRAYLKRLVAPLFERGMQRDIRRFIASHSVQHVSGVRVCFVNPEFPEFVSGCMRMMKERAPLEYARVIGNVKAIVEYGSVLSKPEEAWNWSIFIKVYLDYYSTCGRLGRGENVYSVNLASFAAIMRLGKWGRVYQLSDANSIIYKRIELIISKRALHAAREIGCEWKYIYKLEQDVRRNRYAVYGPDAVRRDR